MISNCPHCKKELKLKEAQRTKIEGALAKLGPGKTLKFGCPVCKKPIELGAEAPAEKTKKAEKAKAKAKPKPKPAESKQEEAPPKPAKKEKPKPVNPPPPAPNPPDLSWLTSGEMEGKEVIEEVPTALILIPEGPIKTSISETCTDMGYQLFFPESVDDAIDKMRFKNYAAIVFHTGYEGKSHKDSVFHAHMSEMSMTKRRYIYYVLIGSDFNTLYDLEALAFSANVVIGEKEAEHIPVIMKKGKADYDELFGPYLKLIKAHGKR